MMAYPWPGNVRELENAVNRAIVLASPEEIRSQRLDLVPAEISPLARPAASPGDPGALGGRRLEQIEREAIIATLVLTDGNRTKAADLLGISIRCLRNKLQLYASQGVRAPGPALRPER